MHGYLLDLLPRTHGTNSFNHTLAQPTVDNILGQKDIMIGMQVRTHGYRLSGQVNVLTHVGMSAFVYAVV